MVGANSFQHLLAEFAPNFFENIATLSSNIHKSTTQCVYQLFQH